MRISGLTCLFLLSVVSLYGAQGQGIYTDHVYFMYVALATRVKSVLFYAGAP